LAGGRLPQELVRRWRGRCKLSRLADKQTVVRKGVNESMTGFLLTVFHSSKKLQESDQRWLDRLKLAAA
jgi:hypothetical protein